MALNVFRALFGAVLGVSACGRRNTISTPTLLSSGLPRAGRGGAKCFLADCENVRWTKFIRGGFDSSLSKNVPLRRRRSPIIQTRLPLTLNLLGVYFPFSSILHVVPHPHPLLKTPCYILITSTCTYPLCEHWFYLLLHPIYLANGSIPRPIDGLSLLQPPPPLASQQPALFPTNPFFRLFSGDERL